MCRESRFLPIILLETFLFKHSRKRTIIASSWNKANVQTWTYRYNQPDPTGGSTATAHAAENYMMFRGTHTGYGNVISFATSSDVNINNSVNGTTAFLTFNSLEIAFSEELIAYWLSFVCTLDPNSQKLRRAPSWPSYNVNERSRIVLNEAPVDADVNTMSGSHNEIESEEEVRRCLVIADLVGQMQDWVDWNQLFGYILPHVGL